MKKTLWLVATSIVVIILSATTALGGRVYLKSGTINTGLKVQSLDPQLLNKPGKGYFIVVLNGPVTEDNKQQIANAGAEIIEYVPEFAFIVRVENREIAALKKLDCVDWIGPFKAEYKIDTKTTQKTGPINYIVTLFSGSDPDYVLGKCKALGLRSIGCSQSGKGRGVCRVLARQDQLQELAKLGAVSWIETFIQPKLCNSIANGISAVPEVRQNLGLFGSGQIIGVADAGLDTGNISTISADFSGRILKAYSLRRPNDWSDLNGHGTHVIGSLLGSGVLSGSSPYAHLYNNSFAGVAPEASLVFQSIGDQGAYVFPPLHLSELFQPVYDDGVRIHSNSWGSAVDGQYTVYSSEVDQFTWDHKDFCVVFAVGNDGEDMNQNGIVDPDSLCAPATAKNCISVGSTESLRATGGYQMGYDLAWPGYYTVSPIKYDLVSNNINGMAAFSGRGPTDDNRIKPDICAPGTNIVSCRTHAANISGWGSYDSNYIYWGGTSMSTPQVAGAAALVREYYQKEEGVNPSAALIKATLISGAVDIAPGQYGNGSVQEVNTAPDYVQGWGRMNVKNALFPDQPSVNEFADESSPISTGEIREYQYSVINTSVPFKATLVWTDYPGAVHAAKELVNDLDLAIISPTGKLYPTNVDRTNNVEQIRINNPELGTYRVQVKGYNIPMGPQDYALVVSGGLPNTFIAGTITSSSGAGVQGAQVMITSQSGSRYVTTNMSGKFITRVTPGDYLIQVGKSGWTFSPRSRTVQVTSSPVENVDFQGQGSPGNVSGTVTSTLGGVVSHIMESPHPYLNNMDQTYTLTVHQDTTRVRVHFAEIDLMNDGDTIYVTDAADNVVNTFTGKGLEDIWSSWVTGNTLKIRIITNDYGNIGYGFYIDGYETDLVGQGGLNGAVLTLTPGNYQTTSISNGSYSLNSVPPGTYTLTASKDHWKFQPASKVIEVPAGGTISNVDFLAFPPGSIRGEVRTSSTQIVNTNVESPHPYPDNYEQTWQITADPATSRIRLHFSRLTTEPAFDLVFILDKDDNYVEIYTADYTDLWTPWINGNIAKIVLSSDSGNNEWGFKCDKYEVESLGGVVPGVKVTLQPDNRIAVTTAQGLFDFTDVEMGAHTVLPELFYATFDPSSVTVNVSPAMEQNLFFYATIGSIGNVGQARMLVDGSHITLTGVKVSACFNGFFYVTDSDRVAGLRVASGVIVNEGNVVDIIGDMATINGERQLTAASVTIH